MVTEQNKDELLEVIYDKGGGHISKPVLVAEIQACFDHWDRDTFFDTLQALQDDNLMRIGGRTPMLATIVLTPAAHRRVEKLIHPTPAFTQNTLNLGTAINSPIQQGGAHANMTQTVSYGPEDLEDLRRLVEVFENHLDDLALDEAAKRKAKVQVATIKAQLEDDPDPVIVKQAGSTLRSITEKVIAGLIVAAATNPTVWTQAHAIMSKLFGGP